MNNICIIQDFGKSFLKMTSRPDSIMEKLGDFTSQKNFFLVLSKALLRKITHDNKVTVWGKNTYKALMP